MRVPCPIYCINLEHRTDRRAHSHAQFGLLSISPGRVIYPHCTKDKRGGVYGCFDSHMRVWAHFLRTYPKSQCCIVFEDDFVVNHASKYIIKKAIRFITSHESHADIIFLHNICVQLKHPLNNKHFTHGSGLTAPAYVIHRNYIQSIVDKHCRLPDANGRHFDSEICFRINKKNNWLYTSNIFFSTEACIEQLVDESDNYFNLVDRSLRMDINLQCRMIMLFPWLLLNMFGLSVEQTKYAASVLTDLIEPEHHDGNNVMAIHSEKD
jgi:hypothetical protein